MPLISHGYVLDSGVTNVDSNIILNDGIPLMCTLIFNDLKKNNNKFMIMHGLKQNFIYILYTRSGRVGSAGSINNKEYPSEIKVKESFLSMFKKLTANSWLHREKFELRMGHYGVFSYGEKSTDIDVYKIIVNPSKKIVDLSLSIINNLFGAKETITSALGEMDLDLTKMPVGFIKQNNIDNARDILNEIYIVLTSEEINLLKIKKLSEKYYCYIPTVNRKSIDSFDMIKSKMENLDDLSNITFSIELTQKGEFKTENFMENISHDISSLDSLSTEYNVISSYINNSMFHAHKFHSPKIVAIYKVDNPDRRESFYVKYKHIKRELLFHGTRVCNWISILNKGLMLNPSSLADSITGKMFGNGIYWANCASKSLQYCGVANRVCLGIAEVAVGNELQCTTSNGKLDKKSIHPHDSVWGLGTNTYQSLISLDGYDFQIPDQIHVSKKQNLMYDEKIIYSPDQYIFRYLAIIDL